MKLNPEKALQALNQVDSPFLNLFEHGSLSVEVYRPEGADLQQPHDRDEIYVIISGSGHFQNGTETVTFKTGDFLFVPAGREHRFIEFSADFATWVFFYGPQGGEKA
ncbi:MAG: cupin domain-containing protein [Flavobacteriaceae bacterium]|nr:cupin domain-containing protein [Flavobacteriaceae bacterium]